MRQNTGEKDVQSSRCSLSKKEVNDVEISILNAIQHMRTPILDTIMCVITKLGNAGMIWILLTVILLIIPKTRRTGVILMLALCVDVVLCNGILKNLVRRIRPFDVNTAIQLLVNRPVDYSFPSGHTAASFASVAGLFMAGEKRLWKPALVLAVLIAFSRLYLYVHYPTDVLGGLLLGLLSGHIGSRLVLWLMDRKKGSQRAA